jgi:hypothetical protein
MRQEMAEFSEAEIPVKDRGKRSRILCRDKWPWLSVKIFYEIRRIPHI